MVIHRLFFPAESPKGDSAGRKLIGTNKINSQRNEVLMKIGDKLISKIKQPLIEAGIKREQQPRIDATYFKTD